MAQKSITEQALEQLDNLKLRSTLNTKEKTIRYTKAIKSGYSSQFALVFALQK